MNDRDYFHLVLSVFLVLMTLAMAAAVEWGFHHPELWGAVSIV